MIELEEGLEHKEEKEEDQEEGKEKRAETKKGDDGLASGSHQIELTQRLGDPNRRRQNDRRVRLDLRAFNAGDILDVAADEIPDRHHFIGGERADAAIGAVAGDQQGVEPEELRDLLLVVGQVLVEGRARRHAGLLEFDHNPGQAVDEAHQIWPAGVKPAHDAELADQQKIVLLWLRPVDHAEAFGFLSAVLAVGD